MREENPYRYEGSAESLAGPSESMRTIRRADIIALFFAGLFTALAAAISVPLIFDPATLIFWLFATLLVLFPIVIYTLSCVHPRRPIQAIILFWFAAFAFGLLLLLYWFVSRDSSNAFNLIVVELIKAYVVQIIAAFFGILLMTYFRAYKHLSLLKRK